jgi:hypothetical protein
VRRGTSHNLSADIDFMGNNIFIGAYGDGARPIIQGRRITIRRSNAVVRDLDTREIRFGTWGDFMNTVGIVVFNTRLSGGSENVFFGRNVTIIGVEVLNKPKNGIFFQQRDRSVDNKIEVGYSYIHNVNQMWLPDGQPQTIASGDGLMFNPFRGNYHYHNNIIDRSGTGNKFCIIGNPGDSNGGMVRGLIENNYLYAPHNYPSGGNGLYFGNVDNATTSAHHHAVVRNNVIIGTKYNANGSENWTKNGIFTNSARLTVYGNFFMDLLTAINAGNGAFGTNVFHNNTFVSPRGSERHINGRVHHIFNNILPSTNYTKAASSEGNNLFLSNAKAADVFVNPTAGDYRLKNGSPAIDKGRWETWMEKQWTRDLLGTGVPQNNTIDIGAFQFAGGTTQTSQFDVIFNIRNSQNQVINNATVTFAGITNAGGSYSFKVAPGTYSYTVAAPGYQNVTHNNVAVNGNMTLNVNMNATGHALTLSAAPQAGGSVTGAGTFSNGQTVTATATPATGYSFVNWTENGNVVSTQATFTFTITAPRNLTANFSQGNHTVTVNASPTAGGTVSGGGSFSNGKTATLKAAPNRNYVFTQWTRNGQVVSTDSEFTVQVTESMTFSAHFIASVTVAEIKAVVMPSGYGFVSGAGLYSKDETAVLTAWPLDNSITFAGWHENGKLISKDPQIEIVASSNRTLVALFDETLSKVDIKARIRKNLYTDAAVITGTGSYSKGETVTLSVAVPEELVFEGWVNQNGQIVSRQNPYEFEATSSVELEALLNKEEAAAIMAFPNPSNGLFRLNIESEADMEIYNTQGSLVMRRFYQGGNQPVDVRELPAGVYIVQVKTSMQLLSLKIVIR